MKKQIITDIRVVINTHLRWTGNIKEQQDNAEEIIRLINDHKSLSVYDSRIEKDIGDICEFCGSGWETDEDGRPLCCDKAQVEYEIILFKSMIY